ncbi:helix-turn-helix domain-containing protein [Paenibacillus sp. PL2-23]|uniref:helix-turn-helix domain-containing protein n=1 Tax=Paenibacillus sp. PL2-23 TaxID=2100729 RepID=UPI0030F85D0D
MMYHLLIVDDEDIAIRGIRHGIDWSDTEIAELFEAYDAEEAKEIMLRERIDIVLSDIDMPSENGIQLLRWVNEHRPDTVTLFLTGHADFSYAQQAVHLDCFDYLLKPIDHAELKSCIAKAIGKIKAQRQTRLIEDTYSQYAQQWRCQRPVLVERFWQDYMHYRLPASPERLQPILDMYELPLAASGSVQAVLVSIEQWREQWSARDEEIMTYAVKNAAEELLLDGGEGAVVQEPNGMLYVLLYNPTAACQEAMNTRCKTFIQQCQAVLHCQLSCYIASPSTLQELRSRLHTLMELEKNNVSRCGSVWTDDKESKADASSSSRTSFQVSDWSLLLTLGKRTELAYRIDECFDRMTEQQTDYTALASFYFGFMHMLFEWLQERSLHVTDVYPKGEWEEGQPALRSVAKLRAWTHRICAMTAAYSLDKGKGVSRTIEKVQRYMKEHLHEDFSREKAAEHVYLNPAYLSRLFRKETGATLTDYLTELRMAKAREELASTNERISDIAGAVGYANFSHFSHAFKRLTGLTPQEYRKQHQRLTM